MMFIIIDEYVNDYEHQVLITIIVSREFECCITMNVV